MDVPGGLGVRGLTIWESLSSGEPVQDALALEAARLADRLDDLDNIIQGKGVLDLLITNIKDVAPSDEGMNVSVELKFQNVLSEARQQQLALASVLSRVDSEAKPAPKDLPENVSPLQRLNKKLKA